MEGVYNLAQQSGLYSQDATQLLKIDFKDADTNYAVDIRDSSVIVRTLYIEQLFAICFELASCK